jgi:ATP-dependent helicase/DNAse subunit B
MAITLITGPANAGKARLVLEALRERHAHGQEPLLVVPTRADVEHYRRELALGGLVLGARVERFEGLLAEVIRRAGDTRRPLGTLARERVLAAVTTHVWEGALRPDGEAQGSESAPANIGGAGARGTVRALAAFVAELEAGHVSAARLRGALRAWAAADPVHASYATRLGGLFEAYNDALGKLGRVDPIRRAASALDTLRRKPALWGTTPVLLYGFDDFAELQLDAIETLGVSVDVPVTVSLAYEPGRTAFAGRAGTFQRLLPLAVEHRALQARAEYYAPQTRAALHHLERSLFEPQASAEVSAQGAVRLLEGRSEREELELVASEIAGLLEGGIEPGDIAVVHRSPASVSELLGEVFRARGVPYALERRMLFGSTAVGRALLGLLKAAFAPDGQAGDLLAWLRAPGVLRNPELADRLEAQMRRTGVATARQAQVLWEAEHWRIEPLERLREGAARGPLALVECMERELEYLFCAPRLHAAELLTGDELPEARALAAGRRALADLGELARGSRAVPGLAPDARDLIEILRSVECVVEEPFAAGGAVPVLDPLSLRARRVRVLFLCGLQEGVFPAPARPEPLLSEDERRALAEASGLRLGRPADALAAERYLLYAAVSRPEERLVLGWHTADDDGGLSPRSLFVDDVCDLFRADTLCVARPSAQASQAGAERGLQIAPLRDERVLADLREHRLWSASALEVWAGCPVRWFVERLLRARDLEPDPEPLARGGLAHAALRDTFEGLRRETGSARIEPKRLELARRLLHAALEEHAPEYPLSAAAERVPGIRRRLEADLERYLEHAATEGSPLEPTYLELGFGFADGEESLAPFDLGDGVLLRGRIDRVDVDSEGHSAVVYDYKGSHVLEAGKWASERAFQMALYMRAVESLLGLRAVGGFYQPLSGRDLRARGGLAAEEGIELNCVRGDARDGAELQALVDDALAGARQAAAQARMGALEPRPGTCGFADGACVYPTICRCQS